MQELFPNLSHPSCIPCVDLTLARASTPRWAVAESWLLRVFICADRHPGGEERV